MADASATGWVVQMNRLGQTHLDSVDEEEKVPVGTIVQGFHPTYGTGEFIYLKGVASTVANDVVTYSTSSFTTTRAAAGSNLPRPIAFAMAATVADRWGWYQIGGIAVANKAAATSLAANAAVGVQSTAVVNATASGKEVLGALVAVVASAKSDVTTVQLVVNRPHLQGRVT